MTRRKYSKEFKLEALKLAEEIGVARAALDLNLNEGTLYVWRTSIQTQGSDALRGQGKRSERDEEFRRMQHELKIVTQERDILKKATIFFANQQR